MAEQKQSDPKYFNPMRSRFHTFYGGGAVMGLTLKTDEFIAWLKQHDDPQYHNVRINVKTRREATEKNECFIELDTWKPQPKQASATAGKPTDEPPF